MSPVVKRITTDTVIPIGLVLGVCSAVAYAADWKSRVNADISALQLFVKANADDYRAFQKDLSKVRENMAEQSSLLKAMMDRQDRNATYNREMFTKLEGQLKIKIKQ